MPSLDDSLRAQGLSELTFVSDPWLCLARGLAAAVRTTVEATQPGAPGYSTSIVIADVRSGSASLLHTPCRAVASPRFSPNGWPLAFCGQPGPGEPYQLYLADEDGSCARQVTRAPAGVSAFAWHPSGESIAFVAAEEEDLPPGDQPRHVTRIRYKQDGIGFLPGCGARIWEYLLDGGASTRRSEPFLSLGDLAFDSQGATLYFAAAADAAEDDRWARNLWATSWPGGSARPLLPAPMMLSAPAVSPDGAAIAFLAATDDDNFANQDCLWAVGTAGGEPARVTEEFNAAPSIRGDARYGAYPNGPHWLDPDTVLVNRNCGGHAQLSAVSVRNGRGSPWQDCDSRVVTSFAADGAACVFTAEGPDWPGELFFRSADGTERPLTAFNEAFCQRYRLRRPAEPVTVATEDGPATYWVMRPGEPRADGAVVFEIHAGAQTIWGEGFVFEFQLLAARGFTVLFGNPAEAGTPRNTLRHEPRRQDARRERFTVRYPRQMLAILADAQRTCLDPAAPVHLTGGSSGGYMTNWLVTQTDAFRSAVTQRSMCNLVSYYGTADIGYPYIDLEHGGTPWNDFELLWDQSPLKYAANVVSPMLILHSEQDQRCPISQGEEWFTALRRIGRAPCEFVRFPGEGHELSRSGRPDRRIARLELIAGWFEQHGGSARSAPR